MQSRKNPPSRVTADELAFFLAQMNRPNVFVDPLYAPYQTRFDATIKEALTGAPAQLVFAECSYNWALAFYDTHLQHVNRIPNSQYFAMPVGNRWDRVKTLWLPILYGFDHDWTDDKIAAASLAELTFKEMQRWDSGTITDEQVYTLKALRNS